MPDKAYAIEAVKESVKTAGAHVINMSLGFEPCADGKCKLCEAANDAVSADLSVVAAVGNTGRNPPTDRVIASQKFEIH